MPRTLDRTTQFKRDYKREKKSDPQVDKWLVPVIELLLGDDDLPYRLRDHRLDREWKNCRDCHVKPDLVLIYSKNSTVLTLIRLGSNSELFG
jgi:mRNA interferase YafQ